MIKKKTEPTAGRGGSRPGSGRKKTRQQASVYFELDLYDKIRQSEKNISEIVNNAVREYYERLEFTKDLAFVSQNLNKKI